MRLSWIRVGLTNDWYPYKKWKHREKRMPPGDGVKDRKDGPISQGTPGFWQPSDGRRGMEHPLPLGSQEGTNSAYTLISDFWPPGPWKDRFPLFKATHWGQKYQNSLPSILQPLRVPRQPVHSKCTASMCQGKYELWISTELAGPPSASVDKVIQLCSPSALGTVVSEARSWYLDKLSHVFCTFCAICPCESGVMNACAEQN